MRSSGVLLHISSLPSPYGIGTLGREAYAFVDFLHRAGQRYWQILPVGPTGYGDSPYQSFSSFAGNPYFIDPDTLRREKLLTREEIAAADAGSEFPVSAALGLAWSEDQPDPIPAQVFRQADDAMYADKKRMKASREAEWEE